MYLEKDRYQFKDIEKLEEVRVIKDGDEILFPHLCKTPYKKELDKTNVELSNLKMTK